jgi:quinol monooxygenase YgiN
MDVEWAVPAGQAVNVTAALQAIMSATRRQRGCLGCSLCTEAGDLVKLHYLETWQDEDDLKRQLASERFTSFAGLVELSSVPPRIEFSLPGGVRGLDFAEEIRQVPVRRRGGAAR